ncbi:Pyridoxal 5'-phosphate synthase subunit PdxT [Corynebacterium provencense]|uniref:Pyridoxal 5'-phosphate synthase subunit PdxT n=1 Tax=Corynebacterium provencense TaxID=1737425 RepID=A0A2Z3YNT5_9CORY|nr:Pyridoxal 5'-phosphate synthase subunit PdxT [Corynebacterium provencense]
MRVRRVGLQDATGQRAGDPADTAEVTGSAVSAPAPHTLIGVLAVQGGVSEHERALRSLGVETRLVRRRSQLNGLDGLVLPGGESTTMSKLLEISGMIGPLRGLLAEGLPAFGTCAGLIMLGSEILDTREDALCLGALDVSVRRNAFGRQVDSFETDLQVTGITDVPADPADLPAPVAGRPAPVHAVFIRAPRVERVGEGVEVLARVDDRTAGVSDGAVVAVRQGSVLGISFHPELTGDTRMHRLFLESVASGPGSA